MICEKCKKEHDGTFGSGRFCSRACSNSRTFSEESKKLKRDKTTSWITKLKQENPSKWADFCDKQREHGLKRKEKQSKELIEKSNLKSWDELGKDGKRSRVIREQKNKCAHCGLSHWQGQQLTLEIDHKDGDHQNDLRSNVEALCPNCHSLTDTWRGRNKSSQGKVSDEKLIEALKATQTIRQALIVCGLSPRGKNYVRANRLLLTLT